MNKNKKSRKPVSSDRGRMPPSARPAKDSSKNKALLVEGKRLSRSDTTLHPGRNQPNPRERTGRASSGKSTKHDRTKDQMKIQRRFKELESVPASSAQKKRRVRKEIIPSNGKKRRGAEMDMRDIGQQYGHLVRRSFQGVLIAEGFPPKILFANDAQARISGYSVDELLKFTIKKLRAMIHPDDRDLFLRRYRDRLSNKKVPSHDEFRMIRGDGSAVWVEMFFSRIMINGTTLIEATIIDITERKNAEEQLRQSEEKYRAIIDNIQDGYYEVDLAGNFTFFNDAITSILGYSRNELRGMNNRLFMDEANAKKVYQTFNRAHRTYRSERAFDWEIIRKDGSRRIVEASVSLIRDAAREPVGFRGIVRDVTEKKQIQDIIRESERRYHNLYDVAPLAFVLWDPECRITDWNKHAEEVFGWKREEVLGRNFFEFLIPDGDRPIVDDVVRKLLDGRLPSHSVNKNLTKRGEVITCEWNSTIFHDQDGNVEVVLSLALDITERKNLEEELFQSRKMESIGRLAGGVAHDLNNMLTPILGYADMLLLDVPMDSSHLDSLIQIKDAAERARDMTRQLLAFSRKQVLEMKTVNLGEVVLGFEKILRRTIREDIELEMQVAADAGNIATDASQIEQIILNLGVNAQDAMPGGGKLTIEVSNVFIDETYAKKHPEVRRGQHVMLAISDTGCGMDSETLEHMFEPFYTTREWGTGLGLATVYGIVKQHNGSIWVSSRPNRGTTFRIYFPHAEGAPAEKTAPPQFEVITARGETILIVEDEEAVRKLAAKILQKHGYRVITAANGEEAIGIVRDYKEKIHFLLTDVIMPKIDGRSLYGKIAAFRSDIKVLYMSGYTHDVIAHHGVMEEGIHFIQKPFSFITLTEKIREVLES